MTPTHVLAPLLAGIWLVFSFGCSQPRTAATKQEVSRGTGEVLAHYERIRGLLAADKTEGVPEAARELADAARSASSAAEAPIQAKLNDVATAATRLQATSAAGIEEVRAKFGEVSRSLIVLGAAEPSVAAGRQVFECPMAKGYPKWLQNNEKISNPYMGQAMAECGVAARWGD